MTPETIEPSPIAAPEIRNGRARLGRWFRRGDAGQPATPAPENRDAERERARDDREAAKAAKAAAAAELETARLRDVQAREQRRAQGRQAREAARARWAQRALAVPTVVWMETVLWICTVAALGVAYALSYSHISEVFGQLDYGGWEHAVAPIALDLPLTAAIAGLYLTARWGSPRVPRWTFRGMTLLTAPLSLGANALHGCVVSGHVNWHRVEEPVHLVSSLIPAVIVVACAFIAEVTFSEHARLDELAGRDASVKDEPSPGPSDPERPTIDRGQAQPQDAIDTPDELAPHDPASSEHPASPEPTIDRLSEPAPIVPPQVAPATIADGEAIKRLEAIVETLARERSIVADDIPPADAIDRREPEPKGRARSRSTQRRGTAKRSSKTSAARPERPPIDRLAEIVETIARERSIAPADVPPADVLERLEGYDDRSDITRRTWVREAKAAIVARSQPLTVVSAEENA